MGKQKGNKIEKKTAEFILTARPVDDPDYNNPNKPQNVLLYVPKDKDDENTQNTLDNIPESIRGNTFDEETQAKLVREKLGIDEDLDNSSAFGSSKPKNEGKIMQKSKKDRVPVLFNEDKNKDLTDSENENIELEDDEEIIDTKINQDNKKAKTEKVANKENNNNNNVKKPIGFKSEKGSKQRELGSLTLKDLLGGNKEKLLEIDDKTLDLLIKKSKAKIDAEMIEYNEFGLRSNVDPEVLEYVTDKKFREGVDLFIPAPNFAEVFEQNRIDIDINPEEMNEDYKEVYEALNNEEAENETNGVLEDDFILLANEGKLPIELLEEEALNNKDEILLVETNNKKDPQQPSYKFITKEEKEFLDKQFSKTYNEYYKDIENDENNKFENVDEEEFEEYEIDEDESKLANKINKNNKKTDLKSKEFNDAINELLPKHKRINDKQNAEEENSENLEEEEEEEFEDFDDNLLDDEYIRKQQELGEMESTMKYSENLILQEKGAANKNKLDNKDGGKLVEKNNLVLKTKKKIEDEETIEDMEKYLYSKEVIEMDLKVINNMLLRDEINQEADKAKEDNDPAYELNYPKKYLDITSVGGTFGNIPKVIGIEGDPKKLEKKLQKEEKIKKEKEAKLAAKKEEVKKSLNNKIDKNIFEDKKSKIEDLDFNKEIKANNILNKKNIDLNLANELKVKMDNLDDSDIEQDKSEEDNQGNIDENNFENLNEKEANKLRKKMLKNEKKEKRKLKKEIKLAFKVLKFVY